MDLNIPKKVIRTETTSIPKSYKFSLVEVILLIVAIGLFYWFILVPKRAAIQTQENQLEQLRQQQQNIASKVETLKGLIDKLKSHRKEIAYLDEALPFDGRESKLHILLNDLAASSGVTVGDITVTSESEQVFAADKEALEQPFKARRSLKELTANVYIMGTYEQLKAFLKKIEESGRIIDVQSLEINGSRDDKLDLRLIVNSYYYAP